MVEFEYYIPFLRGNRKNPSQSTEEPVPGLLLMGLDYECDYCWCCSDNELVADLSNSQISGDEFCSTRARRLNLFPFTAGDKRERKVNHLYWCGCERRWDYFAQETGEKAV
jgi:hypothetical protein